MLNETETMTTKIVNTETKWEFAQTETHTTFSTNDVIDAYIHGKSAGIDEGTKLQQKLILDKFSNNIKNSSSHALEVVQYLESKSADVSNIFLKIDSWNNFQVLITIDEDVFLGEGVNEIYNYLANYERNISDELFCLQFSLCDNSADLDISSIAADGFTLTLKHEKSARNS